MMLPEALSLPGDVLCIAGAACFAARKTLLPVVSAALGTAPRTTRRSRGQQIGGGGGNTYPRVFTLSVSMKSSAPMSVNSAWGPMVPALAKKTSSLP